MMVYVLRDSANAQVIIALVVNFDISFSRAVIDSGIGIIVHHISVFSSLRSTYKRPLVEFWTRTCFKVVNA
jgi:hypothetical protein